MDYLLDTNACIAVINDDPTGVRQRLNKELASGSGIFVSSIALFELWYGVAKSARQDFNRRRLEVFLSGPVRVLGFDEEDSQSSGSVRAVLETSGKPIGAYDLLMAGQALRHQLTLVTSNVSEFSRVKGLTWENWGKRGE
jgi:tRNA(fMet)-specific endonuclease VapC